MENKKGQESNWYLIGIGAVLAIILIWGFFFIGGNAISIDEKALGAAIAIGLTPVVVDEPAEPEIIPETPSEPEVILDNIDYDWEELAWEQVLDEFEDEDEFYICNGHEYDDDEYDFDIEDITVKLHKNGDVTVTLDVEFDFEDNSDNRDCKVDRGFKIFWDDDDVEDEDWDEAEVEWLRAKVSTA